MANKKKKKEEEKKKRKLILIIFLFVFSLIILSSATYAWFSANKNALIDSIDINVATVNGIQVSADAISWDNELTIEELHNAKLTYRNALNQFPLTLYGVSTDGSVSNGTLNMYYGLVHEDNDGNFFITSQQEHEINCVGDEECDGHHYVAFDIFILATIPTDLVITSNSKVIDREEKDTGGQNSARLAFVYEGTVGDTASVSAAQNQLSGNKAILWEPNYDVHTEGGIANARKYYGLNIPQTGGSLLPYVGINQEFYEEVAFEQTKNSKYFTAMHPDITTTVGFDRNQDLMRIPAGVSKIRIYLWLEGEDVDFENKAADGRLRLDLELAMSN